MLQDFKDICGMLRRGFRRESIVSLNTQIVGWTCDRLYDLIYRPMHMACRWMFVDRSTGQLVFVPAKRYRDGARVGGLRKTFYPEKDRWPYNADRYEPYIVYWFYGPFTFKEITAAGLKAEKTDGWKLR